MPQYFLFTSNLTGGLTSPWSIPSDWNSASNTVEVMGGGGGVVGNFQRGCGGGAYQRRVNLSLTPSSTIKFFCSWQTTVESRFGNDLPSSDVNWFGAVTGSNSNFFPNGASATEVVNGTPPGTNVASFAGGSGGDSAGKTGGAGGGGVGGPSGAGKDGGTCSGTVANSGGGGGGGANNGSNGAAQSTAGGSAGGNGNGGSGGGAAGGSAGTAGGSGTLGGGGGGGGTAVGTATGAKGGDTSGFSTGTSDSAFGSSSIVAGGPGGSGGCYGGAGGGGGNGNTGGGNGGASGRAGFGAGSAGVGYSRSGTQGTDGGKDGGMIVINYTVAGATTNQSISVSKALALSNVRSIGLRRTITQGKAVSFARSISARRAIVQSKTVSIFKTIGRSPIQITQAKVPSFTKAKAAPKSVSVPQSKTANVTRIKFATESVTVNQTKLLSLRRSLSKFVRVNQAKLVNIVRSTVELLAISQAKSVIQTRLKTVNRAINLSKSKFLTVARAFIPGATNQTFNQIISIAQTKAVIISRIISKFIFVSKDATIYQTSFFAETTGWANFTLRWALAPPTAPENQFTVPGARPVSRMRVRFRSGLSGGWTIQEAYIGHQVPFVFNYLNPLDKGSGIRLFPGNGNLYAQGIVSGINLVRAINGASSGKYYWEVYINSISTAAASLMQGVANASESLTNFLGQTSNSIGWAGDGKVYFNNSVVTTIETWTAFDTLGIALDLDNGLIWFRKNAGNWNNNPTANPGTSGGITLGVSGTVFPTVQVGPSSNDNIIVGFGEFPYNNAPPLNFNNWTHATGSGGQDMFDFAAVPVQLTFNGGASGLVLGTDASAYSDWVPFAWNKTDGIIVSIYTATAVPDKLGGGNAPSIYSHTFYKSGNDATTVDASGYSTANGFFGVEAIDSDGLGQPKSALLRSSFSFIKRIVQAKTLIIGRAILNPIAIAQSKIVTVIKSSARRIAVSIVKTALLTATKSAATTSKLISIAQTKILTLPRSIVELLTIAQTKSVTLARIVSHLWTISIAQAKTARVVRALSDHISISQAKTVSLSRIFAKIKTLSINQAKALTLPRSLMHLITVAQTKAVTLARLASHLKTILVSQAKTVLLFRSFARSFAILKVKTVALATQKVVGLVNKSINIVQSKTVSIARSMARTLLVTQNKVVSLPRSSVQILAIAQTKVVSLLRLMSRRISVLQSKSVTLSRIFAKIQTLAVNQTKIVSLVRSSVQLLAITQTKIAALSFLASHRLSIAIAQAKFLVVTRGGQVFLRTFTVAQTKAVTLQRNLARLVLVAQSKAVTLRNATTRRFVIAQTKTVALFRSMLKPITIVQPKTATLFKQLAKLRSILISQSKTVSLIHPPSKVLGIVQAKTLRIIRTIRKNVLIAQSKVANVFRAMTRRISMVQPKVVSSLSRIRAFPRTIIIAQAKSLFVSLLKIFGIPARTVRTNRDPHGQSDNRRNQPNSGRRLNNPPT